MKNQRVHVRLIREGRTTGIKKNIRPRIFILLYKTNQAVCIYFTKTTKQNLLYIYMIK